MSFLVPELAFASFVRQNWVTWTEKGWKYSALRYILQHESGMVAHPGNPSYYRAKAEGLKAGGQTRLHHETLCQKSKLEN